MMTSGWETLASLESAIAQCRVCESTCDLLKPGPINRGNGNADVMLVGLAPGQAVAESGLAFAGISMTNLLKWFADAGHLLSEPQLRALLYMTSINKCGARPDSAANRRHLWTRCRGYLTRQIEHVEPKLICTLGSEAAKYVLPRHAHIPFSQLVGIKFSTKDVTWGDLFPLTTKSCTWLVLPHPSGLSRIMNDEDVYKRVVIALQHELNNIGFNI